jgi:hypothetical protein
LRGNEPTTTKEAEIIINGRNSGKIIYIYAFRNVTELGKKPGRFMLVFFRAKTFSRLF